MTFILIFWKGKGWQVLVVTFLSSLLAEIITRVVTKDDQFYQTNPYPFSISLLISSLICLYISRKSKKPIQANDLNVQNVRMENKYPDTLFFIPIEYWVWILFGGAIFSVIIKTQ